MVQQPMNFTQDVIVVAQGSIMIDLIQKHPKTTSQEGYTQSES